MSPKCRFVALLAVISVLLPLPGGIANLCGAPGRVLIGLAAIPMLVMALQMLIGTPISLILIGDAVGSKKWKEAGLLALSLFFPLAVFCAIQVVNKPGFDATMSV
jgi:hypothetical protein